MAANSQKPPFSTPDPAFSTSNLDGQRQRTLHPAVRYTLVLALFILIYAFLPNRVPHSGPPWADPSNAWSIAPRLTNFTTTSITPLPCLSHNDESRPLPLLTALAAGCTAVEADIWLSGDTLIVGHDARTISAISSAQTLESLYLDPLLRIMQGQTSQSHVTRRVYEHQGNEPFVLMLDFKSQTDGIVTLVALEKALQLLRDAGLLTYYDAAVGKRVERALTIVASGDVPFSALMSPNHNKHRDIFFDAPLRWIWETTTHRPQLGREPGKGQGRAGTSHLMDAAVFDGSNSYYASTSFKRMYWPSVLGFGDRQKTEMSEMVQAAHEKGLKVRFWGCWEEVLTREARDGLWRDLKEAGVDVWNVDDVRGFAAGGWREKRY